MLFLLYVNHILFYSGLPTTNGLRVDPRPAVPLVYTAGSQYLGIPYYVVRCKAHCFLSEKAPPLVGSNEIMGVF